METKKVLPLIILGFAALYMISKQFQSFIFKLMSSREEVEDPRDATGTTLSPDEAKRLSNQLYDAMARMGTDEDAVSVALSYCDSMPNWNHVYNVFGQRQYSRFWGNEGDPITSSKYDLNAWLSFEFDQEELSLLAHTQSGFKIPLY